MSSAAVLQATDLEKSFAGTGGGIVLAGASLQLCSGDSLAVMGASGCGKSTLLHVLGGLVKPDAGEVLLAGANLTSASLTEQGRLRNRHLGFVYQFHHLLGEFSAAENVAMPLLIRNVARPQALERAQELLAAVGLAALAGQPPATLSGGERQRVAIARALAGEPACLLADEPTGNLDRHTAAAVIDLLLSQCSERSCALLLATHDPEQAAKLANRSELHDGKLVKMQ